MIYVYDNAAIYHLSVEILTINAITIKALGVATAPLCDIYNTSSGVES